MGEWIYLGDNKMQCSNCFVVIQHMKSPKKCPNCESEMKNAFGRLFQSNNAPLKKHR